MTCLTNIDQLKSFRPPYCVDDDVSFKHRSFKNRSINMTAARSEATKGPIHSGHFMLSEVHKDQVCSIDHNIFF